MNIDWTPEAVTAAATVILACLTLVLAWGTVFLWLATKRLVRGTERTAKRQLRAYINYREGKLVDWNSPQPIIQLVFKNSGQTPAYDITYKARTSAAQIPLNKKLEIPVIDPLKRVGVVGSGGDFQCRLTLGDTEFPHDLRVAIATQKVALYTFGRVEYQDAFGKDHWTNFRLLFSTADPAARDGQLAVCEEGNDADRDSDLP